MSWLDKAIKQAQNIFKYLPTKKKSFLLVWLYKRDGWDKNINNSKKHPKKKKKTGKQMHLYISISQQKRTKISPLKPELISVMVGRWLKRSQGCWGFNNSIPSPLPLTTGSQTGLTTLPVLENPSQSCAPRPLAFPYRLYSSPPASCSLARPRIERSYTTSSIFFTSYLRPS